MPAPVAGIARQPVLYGDRRTPGLGAPERHVNLSRILTIIRSLTGPRHAAPAMTLPVALHLIPLAGFTGLMATSAIEDFRRLIIPNGLVVGLCLLWPLYVATAPTTKTAAAHSMATPATAKVSVGAVAT